MNSGEPDGGYLKNIATKNISIFLQHREIIHILRFIFFRITMVSAGVLYHTVAFKHPFQIYSNLSAKGIEFISVLDLEKMLWETQISG